MDAGTVAKKTIGETVDREMETGAEEDEVVDAAVLERVRGMAGETVELMAEEVERAASRSLVGGSEDGCENARSVLSV